MTDGGEESDKPAASRRELLAYAGGAGLGAGVFRAADNVLLGYDRFTGTNLHIQDLESRALEEFDPEADRIDAGRGTVRTDGERIQIETEAETETVAITDLDASDAAALDEAYDLDGSPVTELWEDLGAIARGDVSFEFSKTTPFFRRVEEGSPRPYTTGAFRDSTDADPQFVEEFTGVDPADPEPLVEGLADAYREHSYYDVPRYAAGSVEDNVLLGKVELREHFESPTDFESMAAGENNGLFCSELTYRGIDAFHSVRPVEQDPPICCAYVSDSRHKHAYLALASVMREDGDLVVPTTFVDYTYALLYDDLKIRWLMGDGIEGYTTRHRATEINWNV